MKFLLTLSISILAAAVLLNYLPVHGEEAIYESTVRLHVIANSDDEADQKLKLQVRDRILRLTEEKLSGITDIEEAETKISEILALLERSAEEVISENGFSYGVKAEIVSEDYPTRYYDGYTLPAGKYNSLKVIIGEGKGKNWWCILFPSVCISDAVCAEEEYVEAGFTPEQYRIIDNKSPKKYKVRFRILEILADLVGIDY